MTTKRVRFEVEKSFEKSYEENDSLRKNHCETCSLNKAFIELLQKDTIRRHTEIKRENRRHEKKIEEKNLKIERLERQIQFYEAILNKDETEFMSID
jgi:hypothetical protein